MWWRGAQAGSSLGKQLRREGETLSLTSKGKQARPGEGWVVCFCVGWEGWVFTELGLFLKRRCQEEGTGGTPGPGRTGKGPKQSRGRRGPEQGVPLIPTGPAAESRMPEGISHSGTGCSTCQLLLSWSTRPLACRESLGSRKQVLADCNWLNLSSSK